MTKVEPVFLAGDAALTIRDVVRVGRRMARVDVKDADQLQRELQRTVDCIARAVNDQKNVYGVNTGFGGCANVQVKREDTPALQRNLIWYLKAGAGKPLRTEDVRGAMLLRARALVHGVSGARWTLIERLLAFLNHQITPMVREFGSIGASGDLVPLASIAGALIGLGDYGEEESGGDDDGKATRNVFPVFLSGSTEKVSARKALDEYGLDRITLQPKEGLALVNGTSMSTAMAASCVHDARFLFATSLGAHALMIQGLSGMIEAFDDFIHQRKPHDGQVWTARQMKRLVSNSRMTSCARSGDRRVATTGEDALYVILRSPDYLEKSAELVRELRKTERTEVTPEAETILLELAEYVHEFNESHGHQCLVEDIQDRYSVRCLPQFLGPIRDGLITITDQIEVEMNSANDNPLVEPTVGDEAHFYHGGNFLAQYTAVAMDQLRYYLGLLAKHLDAQISLLTAPEFSDGLPASLVGNDWRSVNMGLKGLQISGNSIMPVLTYLGHPIADRFATHAEQFNQNINSLSFPSANLARQSVDTFRQYLAIALLFGIQAVELKTRKISELDGTPTYNPLKSYLSPKTRGLYQAVCEVIGHEPSDERPWVYNDEEQALDQSIELLAADLENDEGCVGGAMRLVLDDFNSKT